MSGWCGDDCGYDLEWDMQRGDFWLSSGGDETVPDIKRPIGFMRRKPIVRIKAWTRPVLTE